jgi:hypothetical protein
VTIAFDRDEEMTEDGAETTPAKPKRTPYERGWWMWLAALVACFVGMLMNLSTAHTPQPVSMAFFWLTFLMSALLGLYSLVLFARLPTSMAVLGIIQGCLLGFNVLGRFLVGWIAKMTT